MYYIYNDVFLSFQDFFPENDYIIREGETGDTFFIINKGEVSIVTTSNIRDMVYVILHKFTTISYINIEST